MVLDCIKSPSVSNPWVFQSVPNKKSQRELNCFILMCWIQNVDVEFYEILEKLVTCIPQQQLSDLEWLFNPFTTCLIFRQVNWCCALHSLLLILLFHAFLQKGRKMLHVSYFIPYYWRGLNQTRNPAFYKPSYTCSGNTAATRQNFVIKM